MSGVATVRETWQKMKFDLGAPDLLEKDADALCNMGDAIHEIAPDVVKVFRQHVADMKERFKSSSGMQRFGVALGTPLPLVRVLTSCGAAAADAVPALKQYRQFLFWHVAALTREGMAEDAIHCDIGQIDQDLKKIGDGHGVISRVSSLFKGRK